MMPHASHSNLSRHTVQRCWWILVILVAFSGCGRNAYTRLAGTWYTDWTTIIFYEKGGFTADEFDADEPLTSRITTYGTYSVTTHDDGLRLHLKATKQGMEREDVYQLTFGEGQITLVPLERNIPLFVALDPPIIFYVSTFPDK